jgi:8-oxo-dGTP pyrophosphatase MutT (NUDIX family)
MTHARPGEVRVEYSCPWFDVVVNDVALPGGPEPFYAVRLNDWAAVLPITDDGRAILVRQYRPVVERAVVELPAGAVAPGEAPEEAARRELLEETGYVAGELVLLGTAHPDTGRLTNRAWLFVAPSVRAAERPPRPEADLEVLAVGRRELDALVVSGEFAAAGHLAALSLAAVRGFLNF